jgi:hypothetical protein
VSRISLHTRTRDTLRYRQKRRAVYLNRTLWAGGTLFSLNITNGLTPGSTFTRTGTARFTALIPDTIFTYAVGDSLTSATFARTGDATFTAEVP